MATTTRALRADVCPETTSWPVPLSSGRAVPWRNPRERTRP
ncbi:hypothetical protein [Streptosporangium saharense]|uniref:Uncharacterized protein n=1 Tax=Streptosporangium saharense TaxID=1706840 RepID=A0A7W7VQP7_9ACTN|nr:hypothetical protein [Streptosporangium saharense]MBB4919246.1 hypothetical protein [Streptosporangium saharense]